MCLNTDATLKATRDSDRPAKVEVRKTNPSLSSHISMTPTKRTLYGSNFVRAQYYLPRAHAQTNLAFYLNKKYQT
jgi:hypothetical protein